MATDRPRRQFIVLGVLLVALAGLIVYNLDGSQQAAAPRRRPMLQGLSAGVRRRPLPRRR